MDPELEKQLREATAAMGFDPYKFTPFHDSWFDDSSEASAGSPDSPGDSGGDDGVPWCSCGCCQRMETADEELCCRSMPEVANVKDEGCITAHPAVESVCCTLQVLRAVNVTLEEHGVDTERDDDVNKQDWFVTYRLFANWIWRLGRENRVVLPACVVTRIRRQFPSSSYVGFRHPPL